MEASNQKVGCLMCNESVAVLKEYNLRHHYETKHLLTSSKFLESCVQRNLSSLNVHCDFNGYLFTRTIAENESVARASYKMVQKMAERGKPFTGGNFIEECTMQAANDLCPEKADFFGSISLLSKWETEELGKDILMQIRENSKKFLR